MDFYYSSVKLFLFWLHLIYLDTNLKASNRFSSFICYKILSKSSGRYSFFSLIENKIEVCDKRA